MKINQHFSIFTVCVKSTFGILSANVLRSDPKMLFNSYLGLSIHSRLLLAAFLNYFIQSCILINVRFVMTEINMLAHLYLGL